MRLHAAPARWTLVISAILVLASAGIAEAGWNPLKDIKNAAGGLVGGIGDVFGQGVAGLAGPTITDATNAIQKVIDNSLVRVEAVVDASIAKAQAAADALITNASVEASAKIAELNTLMSTQIESVDTVLQARLVQVDEILANRIGSADIIATKQIGNAEETLVSVVRYSSLVLLVGVALAILFYFVVSRWRKGSFASVGSTVTIGAAALVSFALVAQGASWVLRPPSQNRITEIANQLIASYEEASTSGDLDSSIFFASQYSALDATKLHPRFLVQFAELQRSILRRNALFASDDGRGELATKIAQMSRTWEVVSDDLPKSGELDFLKYEVPATAAMIHWQTAETLFEQQQAGCTAVGALRSFRGQNPDLEASIGKASAFMWLSASYVQWLTAVDPGFSNETCGQGESGFPAGPDVREVVALFTGPDAEPPPSVAAVVRYNVASAEFFRIATKEYSTLVVADSQFRDFLSPTLRDTQRSAAKKLSDEAGDRIITAYEAYVATLRGVPDLAGKDVLLSAVGLPLGIVERAHKVKQQIYVPNPDQAVIAADPSAELLQDRVHFAGLTPDPADPSRLVVSQDCRDTFGGIRPLFSEGAFRVLCVNQTAIDDRLVQFEGDIELAFKNPDVSANPRLTDLATKYLNDDPPMLTLISNLTTCLAEDSQIRGWGACAEGPTVRFIDWLMQPTRPQVSTPKQALRIAMTR